MASVGDRRSSSRSSLTNGEGRRLSAAIAERAEAAKRALREQFENTKPSGRSGPSTARTNTGGSLGLQRPRQFDASLSNGRGMRTARARIESLGSSLVPRVELPSIDRHVRSSAAAALQNESLDSLDSRGSSNGTRSLSREPKLERGRSARKFRLGSPQITITANSSTSDIKETVEHTLETATKFRGKLDFGMELPEEVVGELSQKKTSLAVIDRLATPREIREKTVKSHIPRELTSSASRKNLLLEPRSSGRPPVHSKTAEGEDVAKIVWDLGRVDPLSSRKAKETAKTTPRRPKVSPAQEKAQQRWKRVRRAIRSTRKKLAVQSAHEQLHALSHLNHMHDVAEREKEDGNVPEGRAGELLKKVGLISFLQKTGEFNAKIADGRKALKVPVGERSMNDAIHVRNMLKDMHIKVFETLSSAQLRDLCYNMKYIEIDKRMTVFKQGDPGDEFYVLLSGSCLVQVLNPSTGMTNTVCEYGAGDSFGELALINNAPRSATVVTRDHCELITIHRDDYVAALKDIHEGELEEKKAFLEKLDLFSECPQENLMNLAYVLQPRLYEKNRVVLKQNEMSDYIFFIRSGGVRILKEVDMAVGPLEVSRMGTDAEEEEEIWIERKPPPEKRRPGAFKGRRMSVMTNLLGEQWRRKKDVKKHKQQLEESKLKHWTTRSQYLEDDNEEGEADGPMRSARRDELDHGSPLLPSLSETKSYSEPRKGGASYFLEVGSLGPHQIFPELGALNAHGKSCVSFVTLMECEVLVCSKWDFFKRVDEMTERKFRELKSKLFDEVRDDRRLIRRFLDTMCWERYKQVVMDEVLVERARTKGKPLVHVIGNGKGIGRRSERADGSVGLGPGFVPEPTIGAATHSLAALSKSSARSVFASTAAATSSASVVLDAMAAERLSKGADGVPICGPHGVLPIPRDRHDPKSLEYVGRHRAAFSDRLADEILQASHQTSASLYEKLYAMKVMHRIEGSTTDEFDFLNHDKEQMRLVDHRKEDEEDSKYYRRNSNIP